MISLLGSKTELKKGDLTIIPKITEHKFSEETSALQIQIDCKTDFSKYGERDILVALDKSGSMAGSGILNAKNAIKEMITYLHSIGNKNIVLISYNDVAQLHDFSKHSLQQAHNDLDFVKASGGTVFQSAFNMIKQVITQRKSKNVAIIFFTDGQDNSLKDNGVRTELNNQCAQLKEFILKSTVMSELHTIGFTGDHDVELLQKITTAGKSQGTFQYCEKASDIGPCVESICGLMQGFNPQVSLLFDSAKLPLPLQTEEIMSGDDNTRTLQAYLYLDKKTYESANEIKIELAIGDQKVAVSVPKKNVIVKEKSELDVMTLKVNHIKAKVSEAIKRAIELKDTAVDGMVNSDILSEILKDIGEYDQSLDTMLTDMRKVLKSHERRIIFPLIQEIKDLINEMFATLVECQFDQLNNHKIATLNAMAYKNITKKGLQNKLNKRTQQNVGMMNEIAEKMRAATRGIDFKDLEAKQAELSAKIGDCALSCMNFIEALKDDDCMCLTFDIGRSEVAIVDPTQIIIKQVYPTFLTANSFLDTAAYALKIDPNAHGGFDKKAEGKIVKGAAQENITGILPLYICEDHWKAARLLMKPTLGWTVTLDPLGYSFAQTKIVPFLILAKLAQMKNANDKAEFLTFQFNLVLQTCINILQDASNPKFETRLSDEISKQFMNYMNDPAARTVDVIASNPVFLMHIYVAIQAGYISNPSKTDFDAFYCRVLEEELRRRQIPWKEDVIENVALYELLAVNVKHINQPIEEFYAQQEAVKKGQIKNSSYEDKILSILGSQYKEIPKIEDSKAEEEKVVIENPKTKTLSKYEIPVLAGGKLNTAQSNAIQELQSTLNKVVAYLEPLYQLFFKEERNASSFKTYGLDTEAKQLALYIQNKLQAKNADRRAAIEKKAYIDPFIAPEAFIQRNYGMLVEEEIAKKKTAFLNAMSSNESDKVAEIFATTLNLNEAAGALLGCKMGKNISFFYKAMITARPRAKEKIEMLVTGRYKGIYLFTDDFKDGAQKEWSISRGYANCLLRENSACMKSEEWKSLIPKLSLRYIKSVKGEPYDE